LGTGEGRPWGKGSNEVSLWPLGLSHLAFHASGRHASCDAAALALVRHLVSEYPEAALADLCDTTFLHRRCISSLKFDLSLELRRSLHGQVGGLLILQGFASIGGRTPIDVRRARPVRSIVGALLMPLT
jgi:hypothetical protein